MWFSFAGSASAYMLFYVSLSHIDATLREGPVRIPEALRTAIDAENAELTAQRTEYEDKVNLVALHPIFPDRCVPSIVSHLPSVAVIAQSLRSSELIVEALAPSPPVSQSVRDQMGSVLHTFAQPLTSGLSEP